MANDSWSEIEAILHRALDLEEEDRAAYLEEACPDPALRREVESLLDASEHVEAEGFMGDVAPGGVQFLRLFSEEDEKNTLQEGAQVGVYEIQQALGRGGMGVVYRARRIDGAFEKEVALKVIKRGMDTHEVVQRFHYERQILARLQHPNIALLLDGGVTEDGRPYFVMEYVDGIPIDDYCDTHKLGLTDRIHLFQTVCDAVQYAHRNLVIHRDLKPSNILVTADGTVKLLDFGIAKVLDPDWEAEKPLTYTTTHRLTPEYAAPEQIRNDQVTTTTDVYALGIILYEILTGHRPYRFASRSFSDIEHTICERIPERPSTIARRTETFGKTTLTPEEVSAHRATEPGHLSRLLSGDLDAITLKALKKEPELRYVAAAELKADLQNYLDGLPVFAQDDTVRYRLRKFVGRHRAVVGMALATILALVVGIISTTWQAQVAQREAARANQEAQTAEASLGVLVDILEKVNPESRGGATFTARDLVNNTLAKLDELAEEPQVQSTLMNALGRVCLGVGMVDLADSLHQAALEIQRTEREPDQEEVGESLLRLGNVALRRGQLDVADSLIHASLAVRPNHAPTLNALSILYLSSNRLEEAIPPLQQAIAADPTYINAMVNLGGVYYYLERWDEALAQYERLLAVQPNEATYSNVGTIYYFRKHDYAEAARYFEQALALNDQNYNIWGYLASAYQWTPELRHKADDAYRRAIALAEESLREVNPNDAQVLVVVGTYYAGLGDSTSAAQYLERTLAQAPTDFNTLFDVAFTYEVLGNREQALHYMQAAIEAGYPVADIQQEPRLHQMHEDPRFVQMVAGIVTN